MLLSSTRAGFHQFINTFLLGQCAIDALQDIYALNRDIFECSYIASAIRAAADLTLWEAVLMGAIVLCLTQRM